MIPTPDMIVSALYILDPTFFWFAIILILGVEASILWRYDFGSPMQVMLYAFLMNVVSSVAGFIVPLLVFPYKMEGVVVAVLTMSYVMIALMLVFWAMMLVFSILIEKFVLNYLVPNHLNIQRVVVISNIASYLLILVIFPIFFGHQGTFLE